MIRLAAPLIDQDDLAAVNEVLLSGNLVQGAKVADFESAVARLAGTEYAVAVTNCTAALELALRSLGVGPGDAVAVASYSWVSTANVVELVGARPVFVDVETSSHNMSDESLDQVLRTEPGIDVVLPVHTFGNAAGIDRICRVAADHGAHVIEDAACALAALVEDRPAGAWGDSGCFSFHPRKAVTTGEGGAVTTDSRRIADSVRMMRNHGLDPNADGPDFVAAGYNTRMTEFQAALGLTQLAKLPRIMEIRNEVAASYEELFGTSGVTTPLRSSAHVLQSYVVMLPPGSSTAGELVPVLRAAGIEASVGTWHLPLTTFYSRKYGFERGDFPGTDEVFDRALSLPIHHLLEPSDLEKVSQAVLDAVS